MIATGLERRPRFWKNALKLSRLFKTKLGWISFQEIQLLWTLGDLNPGPAGYEPAALTNWAKGPSTVLQRYFRCKTSLAAKAACFSKKNSNWNNPVAMTPTGIEPVLPPWKGDVLTSWPRSRKHSDLVSNIEIIHPMLFAVNHFLPFSSVNSLRFRADTYYIFFRIFLASLHNRCDIIFWRTLFIKSFH